MSVHSATLILFMSGSQKGSVICDRSSYKDGTHKRVSQSLLFFPQTLPPSPSLASYNQSAFSPMTHHRPLQQVSTGERAPQDHDAFDPDPLWTRKRKSIINWIEHTRVASMRAMQGDFGMNPTGPGVPRPDTPRPMTNRRRVSEWDHLMYGRMEVDADWAQQTTVAADAEQTEKDCADDASIQMLEEGIYSTSTMY